MEDEDDMHLCLVCQATVHGLLNYVQHKKNECTGRKGSKAQSKQQSPLPTGGTVTDIRNLSAGGNGSAMSSSYVGQLGHQTQFTLGGTGIGNMSSLSTTATINSELDLFDDPSQYQVASSESVEHISDMGGLCLKVSPASCQTMFDQQNGAITSQARLDISSTLSTLPLGSMFTPSSSQNDEGESKVLARQYNGPEDHGILNTCLKTPYGTKNVPNFDDSVSMEMPNSFEIPDNETSPSNESAVNINEIIPSGADKDIETENKTASEKVDDFFLSLELMSKNDPRAEKGSNFSQPLLPLTNILNNLTFSSDEDDLGFDFTEDVSFDSLTEDSDGESAPQKHRTSGAWRPSEGSTAVQRNRPVFRGKWPPGEAPIQTAHKYYGRRSKGGKQIKLPPLPSKQKTTIKGRPPAVEKSYRCNFCDVEYLVQQKYANHCSSPQHKERVFGRQEVPQYQKGKGKSFKYISEEAKMKGIEEVGKNHSQDVEEYDSAAHEHHVEDVLIENQKVPGTHPKVKTEISEEFDVGDQALTLYLDNVNATDSNYETVTDVGKRASDNDRFDLAGVALKQEVEDEGDVAVDTAEDCMSATPLEMFRCTVCCKHFNSRYKVARHLLTKGHKAQAAMQPEDSFALLTTYHKHLVRLSPFQCEICRYYFIDNKAFEDHLKCEDHVTNCSDLIGEMMCSMCKYKSHSHSSMIEHLECEEHISNIAKKSKVCVFKESHVKCHCKYCGLEMVSFTRLKRHVQSKHVDKEIVLDIIKKKHGIRNYPHCSLCQRWFQSRSAFLLHNRRIHSKEKPYRCDNCDVSFSGKHALYAHHKTRKHSENVNLGIIDKTNSDVNPIKKRETKCIKANPLGKKIIEDQGGEDTLGKKNIVDNKAADIPEKAANINIEMNCVNVNAIIEAENGSVATAIDKQTKEDETDHPEKLIVKSEEYDDDFDQISNGSEEEYINDDDVEWVPAASVKKKNVDRKVQQHKIEHVKEKKKEHEKEKKKEKKPRKQKWRKRYRNKVRLTPVKCDHCDFTVTCYNDLRPHYMKEHSAQIRLCEICDSIFLSLKALRIHELSKEHQDNIGRTGANIDVEYYKCYICQKQFTDEKYCKFHTAYQHFHCTNEEAVLKELNGKDITREKYKDVLAEVDKLDQHEQYKCPECQALLKKKCFLEHLRIHTGDRPFKCRICPKAFTSYVTLRRHLIGHFGCLERTCDECGKFFKKSCSYEDHMKIHAMEKSNSEKKHVCETCGLGFFFESQLMKHVVRHRKKEFVCKEPGCTWKFVFANELRQHMASHNTIRPYLCDICGYGAASKCRLKRHRRTHSGERKYHCEYCTYKAGNSTHLRRHMRIHIGSKPYKCPYCDYACNTHENVRKHIMQTKKHEGLVIYPCKFCKYGSNSCNEFRAHLITEHEDEIGPDFRSYNVSVFSGLYNKTEDPKKPMEGTKIIQLKERLPRSESKSDRVVKKRKTKQREIPKKAIDSDKGTSNTRQRDIKHAEGSLEKLERSDLSSTQYDQKDRAWLRRPDSNTAAPSDRGNGFSRNDDTHPKHDELFKHLTSTTAIKDSPKKRNIAWLNFEAPPSHTSLFSGSSICKDDPAAMKVSLQDMVAVPAKPHDYMQELRCPTIDLGHPPVPTKLVVNSNNIHTLQPAFSRSLLDQDVIRKCSSINVSSHEMSFQSSMSASHSASSGVMPVTSFSQGRDSANSDFLSDPGLTQPVREMAFPYHDYSMSSHRNRQEDAEERSSLVIDMEYTNKQF